MLQHILVAALDDAQRRHLLLQRHILVVLFLLLQMQIADVVDGLLQHGRLAQLIAGRVVLLARRHQLLQRIVAPFDGVATLLLGLRVRLATPFLVADVSFVVVAAAVVVVVLYVADGGKSSSNGMLFLNACGLERIAVYVCVCVIR